MVRMTMRYDDFINNIRRDTKLSQTGAAKGWRVHHDPSLVDPNDITRGRAVAIESVTRPKDRYPEKRGSETH
jgi:hypothetical protein